MTKLRFFAMFDKSGTFSINLGKFHMNFRKFPIRESSEDSDYLRKYFLCVWANLTALF